MAPWISVIVPFYNTSAAKLKRCLNSILAYTHITYEILLVDDGSRGECVRIAKWYAAKYSQIKLVCYKKNKGLFKARIAGLKQAQGKYFGFVDSDDYISENYFDHLVDTAEQNAADVAVGQIVLVNQDGYRYQQSRCFRYPYGISAETAYDMFWKQEGTCYPFHVLWNKVYKSKLWKENKDFLLNVGGHFVMAEDMLYSAVLLHKAEIIVSAESAVYFYVQSPLSAVGNKSYAAMRKNIIDLQYVFSEIDEFLREKRLLEQYQEYFQNWKKRYARYWKRNIENTTLDIEAKDKCIRLLAEYFGEEYMQQIRAEDEFYYEQAEEYFDT